VKHILIAFLIAVGMVGAVRAETPIASGIAVEGVWARATPAGAATGAVYLTLANRGADVDRLVGVATPVAARAQLHTESSENGVMKMRPLDQLEIKPGSAVVLKPGAAHVMLSGLKQPLKEGETFPLSLEFAKAGRRDVQVTVVKVGAMGADAAQGHDMSHMDMMRH
jgi:copper(I)-binding protein